MFTACIYSCYISLDHCCCCHDTYKAYAILKAIEEQGVVLKQLKEITEKFRPTLPPSSIQPPPHQSSPHHHQSFQPINILDDLFLSSLPSPIQLPPLSYGNFTTTSTPSQDPPREKHQSSSIFVLLKTVSE